MRKTTAVLILCAFGATAPASAQDPASPDPVEGCYAVELGEWEPPLMEGNEAYHTPPDTVRLMAEVGESGSMLEGGRTLVRPVLPAGRTPSAFWSREPGDSIHVVWTDGFAGVRLYLSAADSVLIGRAEARTDVMGRARPWTDVTLRPRECGRSAVGG